MGDFDLKTISLGCDLVQLDGLQNGSVETFEAAGWVHHGHSCKEADIDAGAIAEHKTAKWPIQYAATAFVARTDDEVCGFGGAQEAREILGIVGEVGVGLDDEGVIALEGPLETCDIGSAKALFLRAVQDNDGGVGLCKTIGNRASTIGRVVVNNEDMGGG